MKLSKKIRVPWSDDERKLLERYFATDMTLITLYKKIYKINPRRSYESICRELRRMKEQEAFEKAKTKALKKLRVGYLDIEATDLNGNFGYILSWYIKKKGKNVFDYSVINKKEIFEYQFDKRVVKELLLALKNYDVIYTHYGVDRRFDIPFIRTRAYRHNLQHLLPDYMEKFILDTWPIARNKLKLHSNRLDAIAEALGITEPKKSPVSADQWQLASVGHPKALEYVKKHNKIDVIILDKVHQKLEKIERPIYRSM